MNYSKRLSSLLVAAAVPFGVAACGGSEPSVSGNSPGPKVTITNSGISVPGDQPVSTEILIDRTALLASNWTLAQSYKQAAMRAAAPTIARGGNLQVVVFGRVASHALPLYTAQIPSLAQAGDAARNDAAQTAALNSALNIAVGLAPAPNQQVAGALAQVTKLEGSDIGAVLGQAITGFAGDPSPTRDIVLETDGWIARQAQPPLWQVIGQRGAAGAASLILGNAGVPRGTRPVSLVEIEGLGSTAGYNDPGAQTVQQLDQGYQRACADLPVQTCQIDTAA